MDGTWPTGKEAKDLTSLRLLGWWGQVYKPHMLEQHLLVPSAGYFLLDRAVVAIRNTQLGSMQWPGILCTCHSLVKSSRVHHCYFFLYIGNGSLEILSSFNLSHTAPFSLFCVRRWGTSRSGHIRTLTVSSLLCVGPH